LTRRHFGSAISTAQSIVSGASFDVKDNTRYYVRWQWHQTLAHVTV
jgi:hypothetical protein